MIKLIARRLDHPEIVVELYHRDLGYHNTSVGGYYVSQFSPFLDVHPWDRVVYSLFSVRSPNTAVTRFTQDHYNLAKHDIDLRDAKLVEMPGVL